MMQIIIINICFHIFNVYILSQIQSKYFLVTQQETLSLCFSQDCFSQLTWPVASEWMQTQLNTQYRATISLTFSKTWRAEPASVFVKTEQCLCCFRSKVEIGFWSQIALLNCKICFSFSTHHWRFVMNPAIILLIASSGS